MTADPGSPGSPLWDPNAIPAATVIPLREGRGGLEILMLRRDTDLAFAGGMWVFPGGRLDPEDYGAAGPSTEPTAEEIEQAAKIAAQREADEEAKLVLEPATIRRWSQWTPPKAPVVEGLRSHRFSTAFFVGVAVGDTDAITVDDGEIRDHSWVSPEEMLSRHSAADVVLAPPTFITLKQLEGNNNPAEVLMAAPKGIAEVEHFATRVGEIEDGWVALYHGDVAYEGGAVDSSGPKHRLTMNGTDWEYVRHGG